MWEGEWITVFLGSTCRTFVHLQDRLAVMSPLETDLRSVCWVFFSLFFSSSLFGILGANWKLILDLCLNSIWTQHITPCGGDKGGTTQSKQLESYDGLEERHTVRQASGQTKRTDGGREGGTEHSEARTALLKTQRSKSAKWSFSIYSHGFVVRRCLLSRGQCIKGVMCVFFLGKSEWTTDKCC